MHVQDAQCARAVPVVESPPTFHVVYGGWCTDTLGSRIYHAGNTVTGYRRGEWHEGVRRNNVYLCSTMACLLDCTSSSPCSIVYMYMNVWCIKTADQHDHIVADVMFRYPGMTVICPSFVTILLLKAWLFQIIRTHTYGGSSQIGLFHLMGIHPY